MSIADNLRRVQERIAAGAESVGRRPDEIRLVAVTKYVGSRETAELVAAGCTDLGESRPQELWRKVAEFEQDRASPDIRWHLVGHLQTNKVRRTLPLVSLIHSVDSEKLLSVINDASAAQGDTGQPVDVLLEVNTSGESAKHGLAPKQVEPILAGARQYPHVAIRGLMTMAAFDGGEAAAARDFASLRQLRDRLRPNTPDGVSLDELSMGMSGDFEVAIREGATIVRIGSLLWESI